MKTSAKEYTEATSRRDNQENHRS